MQNLDTHDASDRIVRCFATLLQFLGSLPCEPGRDAAFTGFPGSRPLNHEE